MQLKRHDKSDVMVDHLLDSYSQQASDQSTKVDFPLLLWNTQDDKKLPLVKHLGQGAYGTVYESLWLGLPCAIKVFTGAENVSFKKEADILAALKHPNIIKLFCCTTDAKSCSLVMELMSTDLRKLMDDRMPDPDHVPFSLPVAVDIMLQVARGLKYMHEQRVGHRDIKSSNILVNPTSVPELAEMGYIDVKVADFGLAKAKLMSSTATKQTNNIGTKAYMAPELYTQEEEEIAKKNYPLKADVYSYGITCGEILTGKIPFPYTEYKRSELLQVIRQGERPPLPFDCPTPLANLITRCWDTDPCNRPSFLQVGIRVMAVVGSFGASSYLETRIRDRFGDNIEEIVFRVHNEHAMCKGAVKMAQDSFAGPGAKTFDLVVEVIDNVLITTRQINNQDWANNNCVRINQGQFFEEHYKITMSKAAVRIARDCFPGPGAKTFDLVVEVIDNVLIQTRQMDNQDWANNNCVRINQGQCNHLANKLAEMKDWLLQEHQNSEIILALAVDRDLLHLLRVVKRADLLVRECCNCKDWGKAAVLQAGNEEAFVGILHDLEWWCTHFLNLTILYGLNSSEQIQSLGDVDKLNQFEQDRILARRAALDREELQASDQSTKVASPLLLWNTQDDNTPLISEDLLGRGAYGVVFKSSWLGRNCAKKVFMGADNDSFKKEADILAGLKHPNIIQLFCCTTNSKSCSLSCSLVMELMSTDLRKLMDDRMLDPDHVPFSLPVAVDIMLQVARGLKYMHEQRVGHRDIKSSNILVNPTSVPELAEMGYIDVKVADFGLAKAKLMSSTATKQTKDIGTTPYRAPELYTQEEEIAKENYPLKADVYSYGITCAEILTGNIPFPHSKYRRADLLQVILKGERPPLPDDCPTLLANLITRCWHTDPWDHFLYASVHTMVHVLVCKGLMCICS
ncbi:unnamed protein product [Sphagnum compactum]